MNIKTRVTHSIITLQIAMNHLMALKHTDYYKKEIKYGINILLPHLFKAEENYDHFFNNNEEATVNTYTEYENYIETIATVPVENQRVIALIIEAYNKDPKAIEGICKKILK